MNLKSAPATILLGALGLVLLAGLGWIGLISPALADVGATSDSRTEIQDANQTKRLELARLRRQAEDLPTTDALAADLDEMFPATADQPGFFAQISDIATAAGIGADDVTALAAGAPVIIGQDPAAPAPAPPAGGEPVVHAVTEVAFQGVTITVRGDYEELSEVMRGIETMPRAFLVTAITIAQEESVMTLTVSGATFVAPPLKPETP